MKSMISRWPRDIRRMVDDIMFICDHEIAKTIRKLEPDKIGLYKNSGEYEQLKLTVALCAQLYSYYFRHNANAKIEHIFFHKGSNGEMICRNFEECSKIFWVYLDKGGVELKTQGKINAALFDFKNETEQTMRSFRERRIMGKQILKEVLSKFRKGEKR